MWTHLFESCRILSKNAKEHLISYRSNLELLFFYILILMIAEVAFSLRRFQLPKTVVYKTVLLCDRKRRTARAPHRQKFPKCLSNFCPKCCPFFVQNFVHFLSQILSNILSKFIGGVPPGAPPQLGGTPGAPPQLGGSPPSWGGYPQGRPPPLGGRGYPRGRPPPPVGGAPCEQTNWKHYLPVILRMRAVKIYTNLKQHAHHPRTEWWFLQIFLLYSLYLEVVRR